MLPVAFLTPEKLLSGAGGLAAAIAIGAFLGQILPSFRPSTEQRRHRDTAVGGLLGLVTMTILIFLSVSHW
ncbi:MAG TPA: hypothetical protein VGI17_07590 [Solirubrobacterales bacterium]